jgi:TPP-dependent indolepyruvate ferredoxin oxidoreductase alpha subunit
VIFPQEVAKFERRMPAARKFIMEHKLNEQLGPQNGEKNGDIGIIVQGGLFNGLNSRLALAGLSDVYGMSDQDACAERRPSARSRGNQRFVLEEGGAHRRGRLP